MKTDDPRALFAALPAVDRLLNEGAAAPLIAEFGRHAVTAAIRDALSGLRDALRGGVAADVSPEAVLRQVAGVLAAAQAPSLRPVYNLTGTVLHTNLGRAALPQEAIDAVVAVARGASNLEFDLARGRRGDRDDHIADQIIRITGAEAATVVNNNAAAVLLTLNTLGIGEGVAVSRGNSSRSAGLSAFPMSWRGRAAGSWKWGRRTGRMRRISPPRWKTVRGVIMKVHTSNYVIEGFTAEVAEDRLAAIAHAAGVPFINDLGSGTLVDLERYGLPHEPTPMEALAAGADVVTFSGDKLLGGPQAGIICGRRDLIDRIKRNPMKRALRLDKMTIAALGAVLGLYSDPDRLAERLPTLRWLTRPIAAIDGVANAVRGPAGRCRRWHFCMLMLLTATARSAPAPCRREPCRAVRLRSARHGEAGQGMSIETLADRFRHLPMPVIGRLNEGRLLLDMRCLDDVEGFLETVGGLEING